MVKTFKVGDRVSWNSEAGQVRGKIVKVHRQTPITKATSTMPLETIPSMK